MVQTLRLPALEVRQGNHTLYCFAVDGKQLSRFTAVSRLGRDDDGTVLGYQRPEILRHIQQIREYLVRSLPEGAQGTTTIESKTNFLRAVRGGTVTASTRPLHAGRTLAVLETELTRDDGALVAKVTQSQAFQYP